MAGATVRIYQYNGAAKVRTDNPVWGNFITEDISGAVNYLADENGDLYNIFDRYRLDRPISGINHSCEKYYTFAVQHMGSSHQIDTIRHYLKNAPPQGWSQWTSAQENPVQPTYEKPVNTDSTKAINPMPTSDPGIGTIFGTLTEPGESGLVVVQLDVEPTAEQGYENTTYWRWAET